MICVQETILIRSVNWRPSSREFTRTSELCGQQPKAIQSEFQLLQPRVEESSQFLMEQQSKCEKPPSGFQAQEKKPTMEEAFT